MKIRKDDNVIVITGKDKGKTGKVLKAFPLDGKVLVAGINIKKVHERSRQSGKKGQIIEKASPINVSNVMFVDPKTNKPTRLARKQVGGKTVRVTKRSNTEIK